jgi:hypothetical protein
MLDINFRNMKYLENTKFSTLEKKNFFFLDWAKFIIVSMVSNKTKQKFLIFPLKIFNLSLIHIESQYQNMNPQQKHKIYG